MGSERIDLALVQHAAAPKGARAGREKALNRVVQAGRRLLGAIEAAPETAEVFHLALARHRLRTGNHTSRPQAPDRTPDDADLMPWHVWLMCSTLREWLLLPQPLIGPEQRLALADILGPALDMVALTARAVPIGKLQPYLIRQLSAQMRALYGQPLDDTVALLVSAVLELPEPLSRDDIRPYLRSTGKNSKQLR
jgi:hypothetical protein